jgi:hypothetical protein
MRLGCSAHGVGYDHVLHPHEGVNVAAWWKTSDRGFIGIGKRGLWKHGLVFWDEGRLKRKGAGGEEHGHDGTESLKVD